jgi:hypothetical protein
MLTSCKIWIERKVRVFQNVSTMPTVVVNKIKEEVALSSMAGAKHLGFNYASRVIILCRGASLRVVTNFKLSPKSMDELSPPLNKNPANP